MSQTSAPIESIAIHAATVAELVHFLSPSVPWVWILGHMPRTVMEWWSAEVPINAAGHRMNGEIRLLSYDLQMPTARFLETAGAFDKHGICLVQSHSRMPNTLQLDRLQATERHRILRLNGAFLIIDLPHEGETAVVSCFEAGYLAKLSGT